ncbi:hypothetical protein [Xenorhabdus bharatensis]|uniref:hypothetical protein n=1 Tax=Xenorhabdus bharatensis TaxID=3136256 RepID=UPI0030F45174
MGKVFDFELQADENATKALADIETRLKQLHPLLNSTRDGLRFGGNETQENVGGVSNQLRNMSLFAKDNVKNIGDMIPPLKMFGELSGKYLDKGLALGGIGAIGYGITKMGQRLNEQSKEAYNLDVMAKNNNMTPEEFSRLSGAMVILGASADDAKSSVDGLYKLFNDPLWARNDTALAQLNEMGVSIIRKDDGTADVSKTMEELAKVFPTYSSAKQKTIADFLGFDANTLALLREGAKYKQLLTRSDALGLTVPNELNQKLTNLNGTISGLNASWEGFKQRVSNSVTDFALSDGSINDGLDGISQVFEHNDRFAYMKALGVTRGKEAEQLRRASQSPEFYNSLSWDEKTAVNLGMMTDGVREKHQQWQLKKGSENIEPPQPIEQQKHYQDLYQIPNDPNRVNKSGKQPRGIRNNNPGNLIAAPNAVGEDFGNGHRYVKFGTAQDGISAMGRQIMLDAERGLNTITSLLYRYAPPEGRNNTPAYIDSVSQRTGYSPDQPLDLHNPDILKNVMVGMIQHENNNINPYSDEQMQAGINAAIHDARWSGLRNPQRLKKQRAQYGPNNVITDGIDGVNDKNVQTQKSQPPEKKIPSLYNKKDYEPTKLGVEMAEGMAKAVRDAFGDLPLKLEVILVNDKTGERQRFQSKLGGKVTTSMQQP